MKMTARNGVTYRDADDVTVTGVPAKVEAQHGHRFRPQVARYLREWGEAGCHVEIDAGAIGRHFPSSQSVAAYVQSARLHERRATRAGVSA